MQTTLAVLALLGLVAAQTPDISSLPQCAQTCILQGIGVSGCQVTDLACICVSQPYLESVQACLTAPGACNAEQIAQAEAFAAQTCPQSGGSSSASGSASGSTAASGTATTSVASTASESASGAAATATSSASEAASSAASGASSAASSATGSSPSVASVSAGFAAPTLAAMGVAQILGVAAVVGANL